MAVMNDTNKDKLQKDQQQNIRTPNKESDMKNKPGSSTSSGSSSSSKQDQSSKNR